MKKKFVGLVPSHRPEDKGEMKQRNGLRRDERVLQNRGYNVVRELYVTRGGGGLVGYSIIVGKNRKGQK